MDRKGHYMRTFTGRKYWPLEPSAEDIVIEDIAHALAHQCRFNGHTRHFYSVAEHSVICSVHGPQEHAMELLMHDAAEAYTGDLIRPIKMVPEIREVWLPTERLNEIAVAERFGLRLPYDTNLQGIVKAVDMAVCRAEMEQMMHGAEVNDIALMEGKFGAAKIRVECWPPAYAKHRFLQRFYQLVREAHGRSCVSA